MVLEPLRANLTRDTDTMTKGDPYVVVEVGKKKEKTKPHSGGGKKPKWEGMNKGKNYIWRFPVQNYQKVE